MKRAGHLQFGAATPGKQQLIAFLEFGVSGRQENTLCATLEHQANAGEWLWHLGTRIRDQVIQFQGDTGLAGYACAERSFR